MSSRWVVQWKQLPSGEYTIKARLVVRGFEDPQGYGTETYSPTASRMGQRVLLSIATLEGWDVVSLDIGTAFLQGSKLGEAETTTGQQRSGAMRPPADAWKYLPKQMLPVPFGEFDALAWLWLLLKAVYGLKDAPRLWAAALTSWLSELHNFFISERIHLLTQDQQQMLRAEEE